MPDNLSDQLADTITTHAVNVLRVSAGLRDDVLAMLKTLQVNLISDLEEHGPNPRLAALLKQTNATIASAYEDISQAHAGNLKDIAQAEAEQAANILNHAVGVDVATVAMTPNQLEAIAGKTLIKGHYPAQWWEGQSQDLQTRFQGAMQEGMLRGESIDQMVTRVRGTKALGYTDGIMQASRAQAEALVRTSVQSVANEARINTYRQNPDVIKGIQWCCLIAGTLIETPDGHIPIELIKAGAIVFGGSRKPRRVKNTFRFTKSNMARVTLSTGQVITCTDDHRFLTQSGEWVMARDLKPDTVLARIQCA